jgi:hypothetical protein
MHSTNVLGPRIEKTITDVIFKPFLNPMGDLPTGAALWFLRVLRLILT